MAKQIIAENGSIYIMNNRVVCCDDSVTSVVIPVGVRCILPRAFENCKKLKRVFMQDVKRIGEGAFKGCEGLEFVSFSENLEFIGEGAFEGCDRLTDMTFKKNGVELEALAC